MNIYVVCRNINCQHFILEIGLSVLLHKVWWHLSFSSPIHSPSDANCVWTPQHVNITSQIWPDLVQIWLIIWHYDTSWHYSQYFHIKLGETLIIHLLKKLMVNISLLSMVTCCHLVPFHKTGSESALNALPNIQAHKCTLNHPSQIDLAMLLAFPFNH